MTDLAGVLLRLLGGFYVFAGLAAMRAAAADRMMDLMLSAITLKPQPPREAQRRILWVISALAIGMGGAALVVLSIWAIPLFAAGLATQAFYLAWARGAYPPETPDEEKGRRQTINAALLYAVATAAVAAAGWAGLFNPWTDPWALIAPATGLFIAATVGQHLFWTPRKQTGFDLGPDDEPEPAPGPPVRRVRLEPSWGGVFLVDLDTGFGVDLWDAFDNALADRIYHWSLAFHASEDEQDQQIWAQFASGTEAAAHRREGEAIISELAAVLGPDNVEGPIYPAETRFTGPSDL
ncbi:MAG: hypothetical protein KIT02_08320 [Devosia sp.]|uniref:hypothetical protein n=1 Tax=Devosia sp. TaxID=1871048 RepID=UPI0024C5F270|nr:hypothetical protein [Devosia sp.]UYO01189.1 MAG: hypothetical protein KIT02_08320 [Devosia sp.]